MKINLFPNLGNTCYLNSVLQCFVYNKKFQNFIKEKLNVPFVNALKKIIENVDLSDDGEYNAHLLNLNFLMEYFPFKRFEQQDAHECILSFLDLIKETENLYHGETKTTVRCLKCKNVKNIFEEFNSINLNIPPENTNLTDLFVKYLDKEIHNDPDNLYFCETCKSNEPFEKKINLNKLPSNIIFVLKRYNVDNVDNVDKINTEVTFQNNIKIKHFNIIKEYTLKSMINHTGNLYNGHYTNYVIINDNCFFIDDDFIKKEPYKCKDAYILFYES